MINITRAGSTCPLLAIILFLAIAAYGQQQERVAIIQTLDDRDSIGISDLAYLTDRLREVAVNVLPESHYFVMTTESIVAFLGSQEDAIKICKEASCLADLGRKVNADYVAQARIGRFNKNLTIKTELYNSKKGNLINSFTGESKNLSGLLAIINEKAPILLKKLDKRLYSVKLSTDPSGADLSFDGDSQSSCVTPCKVELPAGNVHITADLDEYETADTTISIKQNNQNVNIKLKPNFGVLEIKSAYLNGIGKDEQWSLTLNGQHFYSLENKLPPANYKGELSHKCYEDISFNVGVSKGKRQVFDMAKQVKLKKGGLVLKVERDGKSAKEPVYINGNRIGETPFNGSVPLCAEIEFGKNKEKVDIELVHNGKIEHTAIPYDFGRPYTPPVTLANTASYANEPYKSNSNFFTDSRDGKKYRTVVIGKQTWMAENLNYNASGSKCYDNKPANCQKYGRLYNWNAVMKACPEGWHIPSDADWNVLMKFLNRTCSDNKDCAGAGTELKATNGWNEGGNGTDEFGFSALPGGTGSSDGDFSFVGHIGYWWATEYDADIVYGRGMSSTYEGVYSHKYFKSRHLLSVRCVKD